MKLFKYCVIALTLTTAGVMANKVVAKRGRLSSCYHATCKKVSCHKGKVGLAVGAIGALTIRKAFSIEIDNYVKPFFKSVWNKTCNLFRRIFRKEEKF